FTADYLSVDETAPEARRQALASYLADGVDLDGGWDGRGVQAVLEAVPMSITATDEDRPVVSVAARLAGGRWINLAVPLASDGNGFAVTGLPALIPAPAAASGLNAGELEEDPDLTGQLRSTVESFFRAYGSGSPAELDRWLAPGERLEGLGGAFELDALDRLAVAEDDDDHAIARATVRWTDAATGIALGSTYDLTLVQQEGRWYVERLGALGA
ncbi:MAG: conjugal transfer protein, partial [Acidimicrobiales bacterium]